MLVKNINPFIRYAFIINRKPNNQLVKCADCRIFYILKGSGKLILNGNTISFKKDDLFIWNSGTEYKWEFSNKEVPSIASVNYDYTQKYRDVSDYLPLISPSSQTSTNYIHKSPIFEDAKILNSPLILKNIHQFKEQILSIINEFSANQPLSQITSDLQFSQEISKNLLSNLIFKIIQLQETEKKAVHPKLCEVLEYIHLNYNSDLKNSTLGNVANYNSYYLNRLMKTHTGITLHAYLKDYRLKMAFNLIQTTDLSLEEIANMTGFKNQTHFYKNFKLKYGLAPSHYRKQKLM